MVLMSFKIIGIVYSLQNSQPTTRGIHPPSFQGQLISFHLGVLDLSLEQETKKKKQHDCNEKEKTTL